MRTLDWQEVDDILVGATILGCGGGGELAEGRDYLRRVYDGGRAVTLAAPDELAPAALVACPYGVGAMTVGDESEYGGRPFTAVHPAVLAVRALADHVGAEFGALICGEMGGTSIADAFFPAAMLDLPVVDADPVGRAVPELEHSMFYVHDLPIAPQAVVNEIGDTALLTRVADDLRAEALVRALSVASRNLVWVADHALAWGTLRDVALPGTVSFAERIGRARREALEAGDSALAAVTAAAGGSQRCRGRVVAFEWRDTDGFTVGETAIAVEDDGDAGDGDAGDDDSGPVYRVWFKNENLMSWRGDEPDITCPDLICLLDPATGLPVTNPFVTVGSTVAVLGIPAPAQWRTSRGIEVLGPGHFGFDVAYRPLPQPDLV